MNRLRPSLAAAIDVVAFDFYGTIVDFLEADFVRVMAEVCGEQGIDADAGDVWRRFVRASYGVRAENHHSPVYRRFEEAWEIQFRRVFDGLQVRGDPRSAAAHLKAALADAVAFDEACPALETLGSRYRLALLSNTDDDFLSACLQKNRLQFGTVVSSERAQAIKPDPAIFLYLAGILDVPPERILYAGDNPVPDVLGAKRAGMRAAWVNRAGIRRPRQVPPPDIRVRTLSELLPHLVG